MKAIKNNKRRPAKLSATEKTKLILMGLAFLLVVFCGVTKLSFIPYNFKGGYAETHLPEDMPPFERLYYLSIGVKNEIFMQSILAYSALYDFLFLDIKPYHPPEVIRLFVIDNAPRGPRLEYQTFFDWEGDRFAEVTEWLKPGEVAFAILGNERNQYGASIYWRSGWDELKALDGNHDDILDKSDAGFSRLMLMVPVVPPAGKKVFLPVVSWKSLAQDYVSLDLRKRQIFKAGEVSAPHPFDVVTFRTDKVKSFYMMPRIGKFNPAIVRMPDLWGVGYIPTLSQAMLMDETLLQMVNQFSQCKAMDVFSNPAKTRANIEAILYRWGEVDEVGPRSRGPFIDGRKLEFLEKAMARDFLQIGKWRNPRFVAAMDLNRAWDVLYAHYSTRLIFQTCGRVFFGKDAHYDPLRDVIVMKGGVQKKILGDHIQASKDMSPEIQKRFNDGLRDFIIQTPSASSLADVLSTVK